MTPLSTPFAPGTAFVISGISIFLAPALFWYQCQHSSSIPPVSAFFWYQHSEHFLIRNYGDHLLRVYSCILRPDLAMGTSGDLAATPGDLAGVLLPLPQGLVPSLPWCDHTLGRIRDDVCHTVSGWKSFEGDGKTDQMVYFPAAPGTASMATTAPVSFRHLLLLLPLRFRLHFTLLALPASRLVSEMSLLSLASIRKTCMMH